MAVGGITYACEEQLFVVLHRLDHKECTSFMAHAGLDWHVTCDRYHVCGTVTFRFDQVKEVNGNCGRFDPVHEPQQLPGLNALCIL